jgi:predicted PurR-regulated permease PerM
LDKYWSIILRFVFLVLIIIGAIWLLNSLAWVVALLLVSTLIVYILHPLLQYIKRSFAIKHGFAVVIVFVAFLLFCVLVFSLLIPIVYKEAIELAENFPHYLERFQIYLASLSQQTIRLDLENEIKDYLSNISENFYQAVEYLAETSVQVISKTVDIFLVLFLVFYLLYDFQAVRSQVIEVVPPAHRKLAEEFIAIVDANVGFFIRGSLLRCLIVGIVTGTVLFLIGMPYALLLGLIAGLFNFILYLGPYIAAIPAVLLSFSPLTPSPLIVLLVYVIIQIMDGVFLAPLLLGRILNLKPITIITSILAGGKLAGLLGMVLAVPLAGIVKGIIELLKRSAAYREEK